MGQSSKDRSRRSGRPGNACESRVGPRRRVVPATPMALACAGLCLAGFVADAPATTGFAARTVSLREFGQLHKTGKSRQTLNETLNEQGVATGTISGSIYIHLHIASARTVTAEVNIYPSSASLSGTGSANYHVSGGQALFGGTLAITRGTGRYAHARASRLAFTGTIQRRNDAVSVQLSGPLSY
jgi:hypothetical protein